MAQKSGTGPTLVPAPPEQLAVVAVTGKNAELLKMLWQARSAAQRDFDIAHLSVCNALDIDAGLYQQVQFMPDGSVVLIKYEDMAPAPPSEEVA